MVDGRRHPPAVGPQDGAAATDHGAIAESQINWYSSMPSGGKKDARKRAVLPTFTPRSPPASTWMVCGVSLSVTSMSE